MKNIITNFNKLIELKLKEIEKRIQLNIFMKNEIWKEGYLEGYNDANKKQEIK